MEKLIYKRFVLVKDDFYNDLDKVVHAAKNASYFEPEDVTGYRSTTVYHEPGVKQKLENAI